MFMRYSRLIPILLLVLILCGCYHKKTPSRFRLQDSTIAIKPDTIAALDSLQLDSLYFAYKHHYHVGFNFVVKSDSFGLIRQLPEEKVFSFPVDSFQVKKDEALVVADIRILPSDSVDSVWVQVATENSQFGWVHEHRLLQQVDPDDSISMFISVFSDIHLMIFLIIITLIAIAYIVVKQMRGRGKIVHFNDIDSFYPTLLALVVAMSATFYASIQLFAPEQWREFYFHPSLNPFTQPLLLQAFLIFVWAIPISGIAAVDDILRKLNAREALLYMAGLGAVCAFNYILFSVSTLYYVGYVILVIYMWFALKRYFSHLRVKYYCGNCGAELRRKGRCPKCGTLNE